MTIKDLHSAAATIKEVADTLAEVLSSKADKSQDAAQGCKERQAL